MLTGHPSYISRRSTLLALAGLAYPLKRAAGAALALPADDPILTVEGKIRTTNGDRRADFDRAMLEGLEQNAFETSTPWFDRPLRFQGVPMQQLMQVVGAYGDRAIVTALNDYQSQIPVDDFARYEVLLALKRNGSYMSVRDKGPLFIIYPFDKHPELRSSTYTSRCAWQVRRITFV